MSPRARFRRVVVAGLAGIAVAVVVRALLVVPLTIESASMEPTLGSGDVVLTSRWSPDIADLERGAMVVFRDPAEHQLTLKRVVGLPGQVVVVLDGVLHVDGRPVDEGYVDPESADASFSRTFRVPAGHVFVMGDNRSNSIDSRDYGAIDAEELRGVVLMRAWPPGLPG